MELTEWTLVLKHRMTEQKKELGLNVDKHLEEKDVLWLVKLRYPDYQVESVSQKS